MSQARKYVTGGATVAPTPTLPATPTYKFKVDNNDFELDDNKLDSAFNDGFNQLVQSGYAKANDRNEWNQRYQTWKQQAGNGTYNIDMQGNALGGLSYNGKSPVAAGDLGIDKNGKPATSNFLGRVFGGVDDPDKQMSLLNSVLGQHIGGLAQAKFQGDQTTADKAKLDATNQANKDRGDFLSKYSTFTNPATALYGKDGEGDAGAAWAGKQFWSQKAGQSNQLLGALGKFGSYVFDPKFDNPEYQKAFKEQYKTDINDVRGAFTKYGYNNGAFPLDATHTNGNNIGGFLGEIGLHRPYQNFLDRNSYNESIKPPVAPGGGGGGGTPGAPGAPGGAPGAPGAPGTPGSVPALKKKADNFYVDPTGVHYSDPLGKTLFTGVGPDKLNYKRGVTANGIDVDLENPDVYESGRYLVNGQSVERDSYENYLKKQNDPKAMQEYQDQMNTMRDKKNQFLGRFSTIDENQGDAFTRNDNIFYDDAKKNNLPTKVNDVTHLFPEAYDKGYRVVNYVPKNTTSDKFTGMPLVRTRLALPNGTHYDGVLGKDFAGNAILKTSDGKTIRVGYQNNNPDAKRYPAKDDLYMDNFTGVNAKTIQDEKVRNESLGSTPGYSVAFKEGGKVVIDQGKLQFIKKIQKAQTGAAILNSNANPKDIASSKSANMGALFNPNVSLSDADHMQLLGLGLDTAGLLASFTGVGSLGAAGLGAAGTTANWRANYDRHGFQWGDVGSAALGYGLDALTAIPGLGIVSDSGKVIKGLRSASKLLGTAFAGIGAYEGIKSLAKLDDPTSMSISDWQNIVGGIQGVVSGKRMLDNVTATTKSNTNTVRANGQDVTISPELVNKLASTKSPVDQINMIKQEVAPKLNIANPDDVNLDTKTVKNFMKFKFWQPDQVNKPIVSTTSEYKLKDINGGTNWYVRNAINNVASMNPKLEGADKVLNRFAINSDGDIVSGLDGYKRFGLFGNNVTKSNGGTASNSLRDVTDSRLSTAFNKPLGFDEERRLNFEGAESTQPNTTNSFFLRNNNQYGSASVIGKGAPDDAAFLKFKKGGSIIAKHQQGGGMNYGPLATYVMNANPFPNPFTTDNGGVYNFKTTSTGLPKPIVTSPPSNYMQAGTVPINPKSTNLANELGINGGSNPPKIDGNFVSELGRALYIRNNNANVDINVRPALLSPTAETSPSVHGDFFGKNLYDQRANSMVNSVARANTTSDAGLQTAKMLDVNQQAQQVRDQGQNQSNQMLYQNIAKADQAQAQYAQNRTQIANQNTSNLAAADESMRQLRNMKTAAMNQPIDDLWKAQDMKNEYNAQQTKQYNQQLQGLGEYATYQNYAQPLSNQMSDLQNKISTTSDPAERKTLSDQYLALQTQASRLSSKLQYRMVSLQGRIPMPDYDPSTYYLDSTRPKYITTAVAPTYKTGGEVAMEEKGKNQRAGMKEEEDRGKEFASNFQKWVSDKQDNDSKESIASLKNINDIIKQALS